MSEMTRVQRWRQQQREAGKETLTVWLPREMRLYIEDMALKRHCSPSDLIQQALTTCYPLSANFTVTVTDTVTDTVVTDTSQIRLVLQQELRAFFAGSPRVQDRALGIGITDTVSDTVTDTPVQAEAERVAIRALQAVTDTVTDTEIVTDTVPVTGHALEPFDTSKFYLGKLCPKGHDFDGTGQSLRRQHNMTCRECQNESRREQRQAKRHPAPAD